MLKDVEITVLTALGSSGFALAFLGAISTLWTDTPTEAGLANFAFALAVAFATVLGNLMVLGAHLLAKKRQPNAFFNTVSGTLAIVIFITGLATTSILFSEGLNSWFSRSPVMPTPLIWSVRIVVLVPFIWLCLTGLRTLFSKNHSAIKNGK